MADCVIAGFLMGLLVGTSTFLFLLGAHQFDQKDKNRSDG